MQSRSAPPNFDQQDWNQFDFSRWHLDGVTLDAVSRAFTGLSERLFNSDEWRRHFQDTLPALERETLSFFKEHSRKLREQKDAAARDFDKRIVAAQQRSDDFRKAVETAGAPPSIQPTPDKYHLVVKVTAENTRLGLSGIAIQIRDPRNEKQVLVQALTDQDGNAVLTVPADIVKEMDKHDAALEVLSATGKVLVKLSGAVCVRVNQVETKVVGVKDSAEIRSQKDAALRILDERKARLSHLAARIDSLKSERAAQLHNLDCKLEDNEAIIAELEQKRDPSNASRTASSQHKPSQPGSGKEESQSAAKKSRKKR